MLMAAGANRMDHYIRRTREVPLVERRGHVTQVIGLVVESAGPISAVGDVCRIEAAGGEQTLEIRCRFRGSGGRFRTGA